MSRPKGSKNKNTNTTKSIIQKINARIKSIEKRFEFNDTQKKQFRDRLKDIVPDSSFLTKTTTVASGKNKGSIKLGGLLKTTKTYSQEELQVLLNKMPTTAKQMEKGAQKILEAEDKDFIGPQLPMAKRIVTEIQARLEYEERIKDANLNPFESKPEDWKDVTNALDKKRPEILSIDPKLVDRIEELSDALEEINKGSSYTKALNWMNAVDTLRNDLKGAKIL